MINVKSDISLMRLGVLVRVLLTYVEPGYCEFRTRCAGTSGDEFSTELKTILLRVKEFQSSIHADWVCPGDDDILDVPADAWFPSFHALSGGQQRVCRTTPKSQ